MIRKGFASLNFATTHARAKDYVISCIKFGGGGGERRREKKNYATATGPLDAVEYPSAIQSVISYVNPQFYPEGAISGCQVCPLKFGARITRVGGFWYSWWCTCTPAKIGGADQSRERIRVATTRGYNVKMANAKRRVETRAIQKLTCARFVIAQARSSIVFDHLSSSSSALLAEELYACSFVIVRHGRHVRGSASD